MSYSLFEVFGVELEYMIVDKDTLRILPIADLVFKETTGSFISDYENGTVAWSNELVSHVIELKTNGPVASMSAVLPDFHKNIQELNHILAKHNAVLMPSGAHPTADPLTETKIWPHEHNEVYALYNRIFDCRGHGWSNLQSTHINLPFKGDEEFAKLHAAIRLLLPIIPALSASTPLLDGAVTGFMDSRLEHYRQNQAKIPIIAGQVIPEAVYSKKDYHEKIFQPIIQAIKPYDTEGILDHHFLNSRGAIARFDRGAIEIRIIDIQECPRADIAILKLIVAELQRLCSFSRVDMEKLQTLPTESLASCFLNVVKDAEKASVGYAPMLELLAVEGDKLSAGELWIQLLQRHKSALTTEDVVSLEIILSQGPLARRILSEFEKNPSAKGIAAIQRKLIHCLQNNEMWKG